MKCPSVEDPIRILEVNYNLSNIGKERERENILSTIETICKISYILYTMGMKVLFDEY